DGRLFSVAAVADGKDLRVKVSNQDERVVRGDVWLSSYWRQPDPARMNQTVPILDADTGKDLEARIVYVGQEQKTVAGQTVALHHFKLEGKAVIDVWYDGAGRLVRQEWTEEGHRTGLELLRLRR